MAWMLVQELAREPVQDLLWKMVEELVWELVQELARVLVQDLLWKMV